VQDDPRSGQPRTQRTDADVDRVRANGESTGVHTPLQTDRRHSKTKFFVLRGARKAQILQDH
jgi:hypothetical protein